MWRSNGALELRDGFSVDFYFLFFIFIDTLSEYITLALTIFCNYYGINCCIVFCMVLLQTFPT